MLTCGVIGVSLFFFFKQKTAYEMRISDWSSDVCSSDLDHAGQRDHDQPADGDDAEQIVEIEPFHPPAAFTPHGAERELSHERRSEEHTSELQSLMRISYAVFCLKKKNTHTKKKQHNQKITAKHTTDIRNNQPIQY